MTMQEEFEKIGKQHHATSSVAAGMRSAAKVGGWLTLASFAFKAIPFMPFLIGACVLLFRSCNFSPQMAFTPPARQLHIAPPVQQAPPQLSQSQVRPAQNAVSHAGHEIPSAEYLPAHQSLPSTGYPTPAPQPPINPVAESAFGIAADMAGDSPIGMALEVLPDIARSAQAFQQPYQPNVARRFPAIVNDFGNGSDFMQDMLTDPNGQQHYSADGMFQSVSGKRFVGTCQMPSEPSKRIQLVISEIRDRGTNLTATLKLIEGRSKSLHLKGLIEEEPARLILIPNRGPRKMGSGSFGRARPWYVTPTRITLHMDGRGLSGQSKSGEQFDLLPTQSSLPATPAANLNDLSNRRDGSSSRSPEITPAQHRPIK